MSLENKPGSWRQGHVEGTRMERLGRSRGYVYTEVKALQDAGVRAEERALHLGQSLEQSRAKRGPLNQGASFQCWIDQYFKMSALSRLSEKSDITDVL